MQALGYENGTRLRARVYDATDGARQFVGWRDTQLNVDCSFARASDGQNRCLPTSFALSFGYFQDAACTQPIAITSSTCYQPAEYEGVYDATVCPFEVVVYDVGSQVFPANLYSNATGPCQGFATPASFRVFQVLGVVDPSTFAQATIVVE